MSAGNDARTYTEALDTHVGLVAIYRQAIEDKVAVMVSDEAADATAINAQLVAVEAAQRSLQGRMASLDAAITAQLPVDEALRPLKLVPSTSAEQGVELRTVDEGERPAWYFTDSYDPEGIYTFANGLEVKWAKVTPDAPDLEFVSFPGELPWVLWPTANLSVTGDETFVYEFWLESPDGRRSDVNTQVTDEDGHFPTIEEIQATLVVKNAGVVTPPSTGFPVANTLRRQMGVYIGSSYTPAELRSRIEGYEADLSITGTGTLGFYHNYIVKGQGWAAWKKSVTSLLESFKALHDEGGDPGRKLVVTVPPFPASPMTAADPGWAILVAAGYSSDPLSWAAAAAGAYNHYYKFIGQELLRLFGADSDDFILSLAHEGNGTWYPWQYVNDGYARNTLKEASAKAARMVFHDQVSAPLQPRGYKVWFSANASLGAGGAPNSTGWNNALAAFKATIDTSTVSSLTGRRAVDLISLDIYPNFSYKSGFTQATTALDAYTSWAVANTFKWYIGETGASFIFRKGSTATTVSGAQSMPRATITVASAAALSSSGFVDIGGRIFKYTGKGATTLTGCTLAGSQTTFTSPNGAAVTQINRQGAEDAEGVNWIESMTDYCEAARVAGNCVGLVWYDADTQSTDQFGMLEHKVFSPVLYHFNSSPTGFVGNGTGATAAKYIAEAGGSRATATT